MTNLEIIHRYLNKEMSHQEHAAFELEILHDQELAEEVALQKDMISFSSSENQTLKAQETIKQIGEQYRPNSQIKGTSSELNKKSKLIYLIPMSIAAIFLLGFFMTQIMNPQQISPDAIYAKYADVSDLSFTTRSSENDELLRSAQDAFNTKDYTLAIREFDKILAAKPQNFKATYYRAFSKVNSNDIEGGRLDFKSLLDKPQFDNSAKYQLGLSYIKTNQFSEAIDLFKTISERSNHYDEAQELIELIK